MAVTGKILITGCQGQLGMDLMAYLADSYTVVGVDQQDIDIANYSGLLDLCRTVRPQWVIHTAAYTDVDGCESNPGLANAVNADGTDNVARAATKVGANLLYFSTDYVFDGTATRPYVETDPTNPQTVYGRSKLAGEERVIACVDNYAIVRIAWLYGRYGRNFVKTLLRAGREQVGKRERGEEWAPLKVVDDQRGNPTWSMEIARQTKAILEGGLFGVFHATAEDETTWYGFTREIFDLAHVPAEVVPCTTEQYPRPAPRPKYSVLENVRLKEAGLNVMRPWRDALAEFIRGHGDKL